MTTGIGTPIEQNLEPVGIMKADSGIWEVHDANKRHFAYTTMSAARGLCDLASMGQRAGKGDATKWRDLANKVRNAFLTTFVDAQGALGGSLEGLSSNKYYDGAVAEAFTWSLLPDFTGDTARATLTMLQNLRVDSGGYKRNNDGLSSYDDNEWILVDLRIADSLRRAGRSAEADGVVAMITEKAAANFDLLPELFNAVARDGQIGKYTGSVPMVGYGGGAYVMSLLDRAGYGEANDCGDGKSVILPKITCSGVTTTPGGTGGSTGAGGSSAGPGGPGSGVGANGAPTADEVPYVAACLCRLGAPTRVPSGMLLALSLPVAMLVYRVALPRRRKRAAHLATRTDRSDRERAA